jgi:hypothetical protein
MNTLNCRVSHLVCTSSEALRERGGYRSTNRGVGSGMTQPTSARMRFALSDQATTMNLDMSDLDVEQGVTSKTKQEEPMIS